MGPRGLEPDNVSSCDSNDLQNQAKTGGALSGALSGNSASNLDDLAQILSGLDCESKAKLVEMLTKKK